MYKEEKKNVVTRGNGFCNCISLVKGDVCIVAENYFF
jgi:hypothetical protein